MKGNAVLAVGIVLAVIWGSSHAVAQPDERPAMQCRVFTYDLRQLDPVMDTRDQTSALGQWVSAREAEGFRLHDLDFEVAQKETGFSQGYVQACVRIGS